MRISADVPFNSLIIQLREQLTSRDKIQLVRDLAMSVPECSAMDLAMLELGYSKLPEPPPVVTDKVAPVSDSTCRYCPQNWGQRCRAFQQPHSQVERRYRSQIPAMLCSREGLPKEDSCPTTEL